VDRPGRDHSVTTAAHGVGTIANVQSGLCQDASGAGTANGTRVIAWTCDHGASRQGNRNRPLRGELRRQFTFRHASAPFEFRFCLGAGGDLAR
jgi:hypothetical protein